MERDFAYLAGEYNEWDTEENGEERVTPGNDIDFRVESVDNPAVLNLSVGSYPEYHCPHHGAVTETVTFDMPDQDGAEIYCTRCIRDFLRSRFGTIERQPQEQHGEEHEASEEASPNVQSDEQETQTNQTNL
jgi:hypothetical protein